MTQHNNDLKRCGCCKEYKEETAFWPDKSTKSGLCCYCKDCRKERRRKYELKYREKNRDKRAQYNHSRYINNKEKLNKKTTLWRRKDRHTKPQKRLNDSIGSAIRISIKGNKGGRSWQKLVGYTLNQLKNHLEKQFQHGMSWDNYGEWHIDHKIPVSIFNFKKPEDIDFKRCWALDNLQPLWAKDNLSKHNKLTKPFQPSLAF